MKKILLFLSFAAPFALRAQVSPVYYMSNYIRVVQPDVDDSSDLPDKHYDLVSYHNTKVKFDTLLNPFTGGLNNATLFNIDFNGDGVQDLYVFDRETGENQFLLFEGLGNNSISYRYAPQYHHDFPDSIAKWAELADYNGDGFPDLFTGSPDPYCNTCIKAYKNTSYIDPVSKMFTPRFKKIADSLCYYTDSINQHEIDVSTASDPQFVDVDKDGYLDIIGWDAQLTAPCLYHNRGKLGHGDSLSFYFNTGCWGKFEEFLQHEYWPWTCNSVYEGSWDPTGYHKTGVHYNNSICAFDVDGDGDIDLLLADGLNDSLCFLENGKIDLHDISAKGGYHKDSMINNTMSYNDNNYPIDYPAVIHNMPTPSYLDINHDSLNDLVVAAGQPTTITNIDSTQLNDRIHNIWYYQNHGSRPKPGILGSNVFDINTKDFLLNTMVDWGVNSALCFIDVDKDGRKDLIIGVRDGSYPHGNSHLILYLNKAGKTPGSKPYLLYQTDDYLGFASLPVNIPYPVPTAYVNPKGNSTDLIIGTGTGRVMYFKDTSTGKNPASFHLSTSALQYLSNGKMLPIQVNQNSAPTAADINGDGKPDLLIGCNTGNISYYRCLGYGSAPDYVPYFELVTNTFGNLNSTTGLDWGTAPCVADLDRDGKPDLLVGDQYGVLWYYHDFDTTGTLVPTYRVRVHDYGSGKDSTRYFGTYTKPAVAYLDQDTFPDIMLGCLRGGLLFLGSAQNNLETLRNSDIEEPKIYNPANMSLFPNPAKDMVTLEYHNLSGEQNTRLAVTDMLGRQVISRVFELKNGKGDETFSTSGLANGIYIVGVFAGDQLLYNNKLIIEK